MINKLISFFFPKKESKYSARIFKQKSWLEKQVDEELRKRAFKL